MILQRTLPGTLSKAMPLKLSQISWAPFLYTGIVICISQSSGILSERQMLTAIHVISSTMVSPPSFKSSAVIPSSPGALLFFNCKIASLTSSSLGSSIRTSLDTSRSPHAHKQGSCSRLLL